MLTSTGTARPLTTPHILETAFPARCAATTVPATGERAIHVIPQGTEPRWIILGDPRKALPVLRSWQPWNLISRLRWSAVLFAASIKMLPRLPGVSNSCARIDSCYWERNLPDFSESWSAVVHLGSPSHTRKAIVFFIGEDQRINDRRVKAVAKVPLSPAAARSILNEAAILLRMKAHIHLPSVLFQDLDQGVTAQSWIEGKPVSRGFTAEHLDLLCRLVNPGSTTRVSEYRKEIEAQLDTLDLPFERPLLVRALELLNFDEPLQGFVEHRDFAPWNLKRFADGSLGLLDWEWAVPNSLPWQDVSRLFYVQDALLNGPGKVWEAMNTNHLLQTYCRRFAIPPAALPALTMHYLLRVLCMDWESGNRHMARHTFEQIQLLLAFGRKTTMKP